jgi:RNA 2'-phosphotransferase, Tpt1 / KptA family
MSSRGTGHIIAKLGRGGRGGAGTSRSEDDIRLSKKLSRMLRHNPPPCMDKSGWVPIEVVKSALGSVKDTAQLLRVVEGDEKGRFQVRILSVNRPVCRCELSPSLSSFVRCPCCHSRFECASSLIVPSTFAARSRAANVRHYLAIRPSSRNRSSCVLPG